MKELHVDEIIGAVKLNSEWRFFALVPPEWIMDYIANDPSAAGGTYPHYRNNLMKFDETNVYEFFDAVKECELTLANIAAIRGLNNFEPLPVEILIDFDDKLYVNGYFDLLLEKYVPKNWQGIYDDPFKYLPPHIQSCFINKL